MPERLERQLRFILEVDRLKHVLRRSYTLEPQRRENSAEHSWHVALLASLLAEYANEPVDAARVVRMLLVHDLVEIDAGDTIIYDTAARQAAEEAEIRAAERIFGLLPCDQAREWRALWDEFEARESPEARFARAVDRLMPLLHNLHTGGRSWREHSVCASQVLNVNRVMAAGSEPLWEYICGEIESAVRDGRLPREGGGS